MRKIQAKYTMRHLSGEGGITLVQLVPALLLLGILSVVAVLNYLGAENIAKSKVDQSNVSAINMALALYRFRIMGTAHQTKRRLQPFWETRPTFRAARRQILTGTRPIACRTRRATTRRCVGCR